MGVHEHSEVFMCAHTYGGKPWGYKCSSRSVISFPLQEKRKKEKELSKCVCQHCPYAGILEEKELWL